MHLGPQDNRRERRGEGEKEIGEREREQWFCVCALKIFIKRHYEYQNNSLMSNVWFFLK